MESAALIAQVDIQRESLPGPGAPAGKPLAGRHGSAAPCRLARRVGRGGRLLTGIVPLPSRGQGGNKKQCDFSSNGLRHYREFVQLMVLFTLVCNAGQTYSWWLAWAAWVFFSCLGLKFKPTVQ